MYIKKSKYGNGKNKNAKENACREGERDALIHPLLPRRTNSPLVFVVGFIRAGRASCDKAQA